MKADVLSMSGNLFSFWNNKCVCLIETTYTHDEREKKTLRIRENPDERVLFAYQPGNGLVTIDPKTGSILQPNILQELISVDYDDIEGLKNFFETYGFFVPLTAKRLETFSANDIYNIHRHIKYTLELMSLIQMKHPNYKKIYSEICWLTFVPPTILSVQTDAGTAEDIYHSCLHNFQGYLSGQIHYQTEHNEDEAMMYGSLYDDPNAFFEIPDSVRPPKTKIHASAFMDADFQDSDLTDPTNHYSKYPRILPGTLLRTFGFATNINTEDRHTIEFFYHMENEIGQLCYFSDKYDAVFLNDVDEKFNKNFDDTLKKAMIRVAKKTIKEEIDFNLSEMVPSYNMQTMSPAWSIPDLLTGLFFSLFYTKADLEIYRECENPNCSTYFLVSTTNSRKKYCCSACANAMAQRNHRKKNRAKMAPPI